MASGRKIAVSVSVWGNEETIYMWKWVKAHLLQLKKGDQLYIVHVARSKDKDLLWDQGSAVVKDIHSALQNYNANIQILEGDVGPALVDFVSREFIDVLVLGSRGRSVKKAMLGSVTDYVMNRVHCPCLVVKPQLAVGDAARLRNATTTPVSPVQGCLATPPAPTPGSNFTRAASLVLPNPLQRRVAIAYDTTAHGQYLLAWAAKNLLKQDDSIFVVRMVPKLRKASSSFADRSGVQKLALQVLPEYKNKILAFSLQGKMQVNLCTFVENEGVDLLVLGMYKDRRKFRILADRKNVSFIYNRCPCPCLVVYLSEELLQASLQPQDLSRSEQEALEILEAAEEEEEDSEGEEVVAQGGDPPEKLWHRISVPAMPSLNIFRSSLRKSDDAGLDKAVASKMIGQPAGLYLVEVDEGGQVKRIQPYNGAPSATLSRGASGVPGVSGPSDGVAVELSDKAASLTDGDGQSGMPRSSSGPSFLGAEVPGPSEVAGEDLAVALKKEVQSKETELNTLKEKLKALQLPQEPKSASRLPPKGPVLGSP